MNKKTFGFIIKGLNIIIISLFLFACSSKKAGNTDIIGSWESVDSPGSFYSFNQKNKGFFDSDGMIMNFTYKIDGNKLEITWEGSSDPQIWEFKIVNNILGLKNEGSDAILSYKKK